jgi:hypothetical protein
MGTQQEGLLVAAENKRTEEATGVQEHLEANYGRVQGSMRDYGIEQEK